MRALRRWPRILAALLLAGCNVSSGEPEQQNFAQLYTRASCRLALECCDGEQAAEVLGLSEVPKSVEDCVTLASLGLGLPPDLAQALGSDVPLSERRFDERAAALCLARFRERGCVTAQGDEGPSDFLEKDPFCARILVGQTLPGGACQSDRLCASGSCRDGACAPWLVERARCDERCEAGAPPTVCGGPEQCSGDTVCREDEGAPQVPRCLLPAEPSSEGRPWCEDR